MSQDWDEEDYTTLPKGKNNPDIGFDNLWDWAARSGAFDPSTDAQNSSSDPHYGILYPRKTSAFFSNDCDHVWKEYIGFNDSFIYCEKCDKKKGML